MEIDLFEEMATEVVRVAQPIVETKPGPLTREEKIADKLRSLEDELLNESLQIVSDAMKFRDIEPGAEGYPDEWTRGTGLAHDEAVKRLRVAKLAHLPPKDAPVAFVLAQRTAVGIIKARATEKASPRELNAVVFKMEIDARVYPQIKVEK